MYLEPLVGDLVPRTATRPQLCIELLDLGSRILGAEGRSKLRQRDRRVRRQDAHQIDAASLVLGPRDLTILPHLIPLLVRATSSHVTRIGGTWRRIVLHRPAVLDPEGVVERVAVLPVLPPLVD